MTIKTFKEKIKNLTWFNLIELLQDLLSDLNLRVKTLEEKPASGGGSNDPVSATTSGIVNNISLQELGGVDKLINGVRIGKGNNNLDYNTVLGVDSMSLITTAVESTGIGQHALKSLTTGSYNTGVGSQSLAELTIGTNNTAIGSYSLVSIVSGTDNTGLGQGTLGNLISGKNNTTIGSFAGNYILGNDNTAIGYLTLSTNSSTPTNNTGALNTTLGSRAGRYITTGNGNIVISASSSSTGGATTAVSTGSNNVILNPGDCTTNTGVTTGSGNILIGKVTGLAAGLNNTLILSDGVGTQRLVSNSTNLTTLPAQTSALIVADATNKAIVNKEYTNNIGAVNNTTTTALTSAALTTAYPNALIGFRVQCLAIAGGAIVYQKTATGWIQSPVTVVA